MEFQQSGAGAQRDDAVGGKLREAMLDTFADLQRRQPAGDGFRLEEEPERSPPDEFRIELKRDAALEGEPARGKFQYLPFALPDFPHGEEIRVAHVGALQRLLQRKNFRIQAFQQKFLFGNRL